MKRLIDLCTHDSSVCASYVHIRLYQNSIYISLLKFKSMILTFALTETFSANICNICIASIFYSIRFVVDLINYFLKHLFQHYKSIIFIEDDTEGIIM